MQPPPGQASAQLGIECDSTPSSEDAGSSDTRTVTWRLKTCVSRQMNSYSIELSIILITYTQSVTATRYRITALQS